MSRTGEINDEASNDTMLVQEDIEYIGTLYCSAIRIPMPGGHSAPTSRVSEQHIAAKGVFDSSSCIFSFSELTKKDSRKE
jgi:hypothetical protein